MVGSRGGANYHSIKRHKTAFAKEKGGGVGEEYYWTNKAPSSERDFISQSTTQTIMTDLVLGRNS